MSKTTFVTGADSFIGSHLVENLLRLATKLSLLSVTQWELGLVECFAPHVGELIGVRRCRLSLRARGDEGCVKYFTLLP